MQTDACHAAWLLAAPSSLRASLARAGVTLALAAAYGAALGARGGPASMLRHAAGAPLALVAVLALSVPALAIALALVDSPVRLLALVRAAGRSAALAGLVLGGLAPALALFAITGEDAVAGAVFAASGLGLAGALAARAFRLELGALAAPAPAKVGLLVGAFVLFSAVLAARVWWLVLPALHGGAA